MVYNVIIVDDEPAILKSMVNIIDWDKLNLSVVALCYDGQEAIDFICNNTVHIVLADIKMPVVDGIQLTKWIKDNRPAIKTVLISGLHDFEAARTAIENNVSRYLLKPTRYSELVSTMETLIKELNKVDEDLNADVLYLGRKQFMFDLSKGAVSGREKIEANFRALDLPGEFIDNPCIMTGFHIPDYHNYIATVWNYGVGGLVTALDKIFGEPNTNGSCFVFNHTEGYFNTLMFTNQQLDKDRTMKGVIDFFDYVRKNTQEILQTDIEIKSIKYFENINEMINGVLNPKTWEEEKEHIELLLYYMNRGNGEAVDTLLTNYHSLLKSRTIEETHRFTEKLIEKIKTDFRFYHSDMLESLEYIKTYLTHKQVFSKMRTVLLEMTALAQDKITNGEFQTAEKIKHYIAEHYSEDITLESMSKVLYLTPTYISRLFREQTGEKFIDYLIKARLEKARELLRDTDIKVYNIAEHVGYKNLKYFYKIFKEYTNLSPTAYRNLDIRKE